MDLMYRKSNVLQFFYNIQPFYLYFYLFRQSQEHPNSLKIK